MEGKFAERYEHYEERNHFRLCSIESGPKSRTRYKRIQLTCYNFLERPNGVLSVSYHFTLFGLVVVGLVFAILETMDELKQHDGLMLATYILEVFLLIVFTLEYILRMWSAGCRSTYSGAFGRLRFAFKPFVVIDTMVIGSTFGVIIYASKTNLSSTISILRFFQVLRMVRFDRQGASWKLLGSVLFLHRQELLTTFYIGFCSLIFASFFVYQAEQVGNESEFGTFADSFWWGVVTLTTVGYGDKVPKSWAGRGVAAFFAIMGISFFALPAGILGSGFALKVSQQQRQKHVKRRRRPAAMLIQCNWRYYASRKNSKLHATWSPYIKYLKAKSSKKVDHTSEKQSHQAVGRVRKLSMFGRKASGLSSDGISKPVELTTPEQAWHRTRKVVGSELFHSNDSLQYSTADQHMDDEHDGSPKPILVTDADGNISLPAAYKQSIRFTRYLKFLVALRKFKLAKKPYDVKDVIEQYSTGHVEVLGKVKSIGYKIDEALGYNIKTEKLNESSPGRPNVVHRLSKLEKQVKTLENKVDRVISLLEDSKKDENVPDISKGYPSCAVCGHSYKQRHYCNGEESKSVRRRKLGILLSNQSANTGSLCEREEHMSVDDIDRSIASMKLANNFAEYLERNHSDTSLNLETDCSHGYLSPNDSGRDERYHGGGNYQTGNSQQSSTYGISDNCPSPNPSSSDESCQSKDMFKDQNRGEKLLLPDDSKPSLQNFNAPEHGNLVEIPAHNFVRLDHTLPSGLKQPNFGTHNEGYLVNNPSPNNGHNVSGREIPGSMMDGDDQLQQDYIQDQGHSLSKYCITGNSSQTFSAEMSQDGKFMGLSQSDNSDVKQNKTIFLDDHLSSEHCQLDENYSHANCKSLLQKTLPQTAEDSSLTQEHSTAHSNYPEIVHTNVNVDGFSPKPSTFESYDLHPRADSLLFTENRESVEHSSESELALASRTSTCERSHEDDVAGAPLLLNDSGIQETRM